MIRKARPTGFGTNRRQPRQESRYHQTDLDPQHHRPLHRLKTPNIARRSPNACAEFTNPKKTGYTYRLRLADVAQSVEQLIRNEKVEGSIPFIGTMNSSSKVCGQYKAPRNQCSRGFLLSEEVQEGL